MSGLRFAPRTFLRGFSSTPKAQLSRISVIGRLAATPEARTLQSGKEIVRYTVGVNRGVGDAQQTSWWKISSFSPIDNKLSEKLLSLEKGTQVYVEGDIWTNKYETEDGKTNTGVSIIQTRFEVLRRPAEPRSEGEAEQAE